MNVIRFVRGIATVFAVSFAICCVSIALGNLWREKGKKRPLSKALFPAIALTLPLLVVLPIFLDRVTPAELTRNDIARTLSRIERYAKQHGSLPPSLDGLPTQEGSRDKITDEWGRRLLYDTNSDGTITLASLGADGRAGGAGEDADAIATCRVYRPDGSLWIGAPDWDNERNSCTREMFSPKEYPRTYRKK
ncbi:MAG TPA: type II secretion system protein GspG [Bryobacteraceae bacterium]|nr:type II secretion system protein GspG [Bryobacteraceae bacterium]